MTLAELLYAIVQGEIEPRSSITSNEGVTVTKTAAGKLRINWRGGSEEWLLDPPVPVGDQPFVDHLFKLVLVVGG
jgi:hypothetical protein